MADTRRAGPEAREHLGALVQIVATTSLDHPSWPSLTEAAQAATAELAAHGRIPPHLVVEPGDPPVVVARKLAVAWRHACRELQDADPL